MRIFRFIFSFWLGASDPDDNVGSPIWRMCAGSVPCEIRGLFTGARLVENFPLVILIWRGDLILANGRLGRRLSCRRGNGPVTWVVAATGMSPPRAVGLGKRGLVVCGDWNVAALCCGDSCINCHKSHWYGEVYQ